MADGSTRVTYDAELALKGPFRLADPLLGLASIASATEPSLVSGAGSPLRRSMS